MIFGDYQARRLMEDELVKSNKQVFRMFEFPSAFGFTFGTGWWNIAERLVASVIDLNKNLGLDIQVVKLDSSSGFPVFILDSTCDEIEAVVSEYEAEARNTCEKCGSHDEVSVSVSAYSSYSRLCKECSTKIRQTLPENVTEKQTEFLGYD